MSPSTRKALWAGGFVTVLAGLAWGHAVLLSRPSSWLVGIVPDDAFYYLKIARHLAAGHGSTFDGIHSTSGYHPGWMVLLVPLAAVVTDPDALLRGALILELLLHMATGVALTGLFRRFTSPGLAMIGALCWLANPFALHLSLQGVESALYALSLVILLRSALRVVEAPATDLLPHFQLGGALALCFLARTEAGILAVLTCALVAIRRRPALRSTFLVAGTFALCVLPWILYCWAATGSPWQSSGVAKALWARQFLDPMSIPQRLTRVAVVVERWLGPPWIGGALDWPFEGISPFLYAAVLPAAIGLLRSVRRPAENRPLIVGTVCLLGASILTGAVYGLFYWETPDWYHAQPALLIFIVTYLWITRVAAGNRWNPVLPAMLLLITLLGAISFYRDPPVHYPWQRDFYTSQAAFEKLVPTGEAIGCFNAGIPAFFGTRRIVNLDGLVNDSVVPYYRDRNLDRYFGEQGIHYLADESQCLDRVAPFMSGPLRLQPLASVPLHGLFSPRRVLWRVVDVKPAPR